MSLKHTFKNAGWLAGLKGAEFLLPLITLPYLVRTVGLENFGAITYAITIGLYFSTIIQYGFTLTATKQISEARGCIKSTQIIVNATLYSSLILAIGGFGVFYLSANILIEDYDLFRLYLYAFAFTAFQAIFPSWYFQGVEKMQHITYVTISTRALYLIGLFLIVKDESDYIYVPAINATAAAAALAYSIVLVKKHSNITIGRPKLAEVKTQLRTGFSAFVVQLAPNLYNNTTNFLLGYYSGNVALGVYTAATRLIDAASSAGYIIQTAFYPYLCKNKDGFRLFKNLMMTLGLLGSILMAMSAGILVDTLYGENNEIKITLQYLSISILMIFAILTFGHNYLIANGNEKLAKKITLTTSILFLAIGWVLVKEYGLVGAIVTVVGARTSLALLNFIAYKKVKSYEYC